MTIRPSLTAPLEQHRARLRDRLVAVVLGVVLGLALAPAATGEVIDSVDDLKASPTTSPWTPSATGDGDLATRVLHDTGAAVAPTRIGLGTYLRDLTSRLQQATTAWLAKVFANAKGLSDAIAFGAKALVSVAMVILTVWLLTILVRLWKRRSSAAGTVSREGFDRLPSRPPLERDVTAWRQRWKELLAAGKLDEALEALWWWLARSLAGPDADPSWTSRELLERFRRKDLLLLVRQLDSFQYGPRRPTRNQVEGLASALERALV